MNYLSGQIEGDILIVEFRVAAAIDRLTVDSVSHEWMGRLRTSGLKKLIIDFSSLEFLSSGLLGKLVELRSACLRTGVSLKLCCLSQELKNVLSLTRLNGQFKTYHSRRSAIERFSADNFLVRQAFFARYAAEPEMESIGITSAPTRRLELFPSSGNMGLLEF
jgi:anti-sigma B factor antagonist